MFDKVLEVVSGLVVDCETKVTSRRGDGEFQIRIEWLCDPILHDDPPFEGGWLIRGHDGSPEVAVDSYSPYLRWYGHDMQDLIEVLVSAGYTVTEKA